MIRETRSGILPVDKGPDVTSFQVVAQLRRVLRAPKIGHGGTLDPAATGLLPILIGEATKLTPYLVELDKEYLATVRLGVSTDTQDLSGTVLESLPVPGLDAATVAKALTPFVGLIRQVPPMYSALHHEGRRLYELAREGVEVERQAREVTVHAIHLEALTLPDLVLRVTCGKGFYVRTLAADLGAALGTGGPWPGSCGPGWDHTGSKTPRRGALSSRRGTASLCGRARFRRTRPCRPCRRRGFRSRAPAPSRTASR